MSAAAFFAGYSNPIALSPTLPAPPKEPTDLEKLLKAADAIAQSGGVTNPARIAEGWRLASTVHFAALARMAGVRVGLKTFPEFCAELERRCAS